MKYFKSKRNIVLLNRGVVEKYHASVEAAAYEAEMLRKLHKNGLAVPRLISLEENLVKMEYIAGLTLPDLIDKWEAKPPSSDAVNFVAEGLIIWLANFYAATGTENCGRGDINGRNFIFDGEKIWGIDFEDHAAESAEADIALLAAYILTYNPTNTPLKQALTARILQQAAEILNLDPGTLETRHQEEIAKLKTRRQAKFDRK
ncbi:MAG: hypothetical protein LBE35_08170 [Clostridiales bacterium]|jgi:RIO-like serine/threonine protein kinase|nr:hypothetical protein [Clostridiales bacterium]